MFGPVRNDQSRLEELYRIAKEERSLLPIFANNALIVDPANPDQVILIDRTALDCMDESHGHMYSAYFYSKQELAETMRNIVSEHKQNLLKTDRMLDFALAKNPVVSNDTNIEDAKEIYNYDLAIKKSLRLIKRKTGLVIDNPLVNDAQDSIDDICRYFNQLTLTSGPATSIVDEKNPKTILPVTDKSKDAQRVLAESMVVKTLLYPYSKN